jgi:putative hydrolase of the HAD superfamily
VIRALISDFGGVLTTPLTDGFRAFRKEAGVSLEELGMAMQRAAEQYGEHPLFALERGEIAEAEFARRLDEQLGDGFDFMRLRHHLGQIEPNPPMIAYVRELRERGLRTALLTNNVREWEPMWRAKLPELDELFELVVDSAFVGMRKPEPRIYELTLERLGGGLRAEECLFVDDLDVNCEAARDLGMTAVRFEDAEQAMAELEAALQTTFSRNVRGDRPSSP